MAAFTATISYPDNKQIDLRDTLAVAFGYQTTVDDGEGNSIPNPVTKAQFIQSKANEFLYTWLKNTYKSSKELDQLIANQSTNDLGGSFV